MKNRAAFTMIELIFVIVIIGILTSVALPKFGAISEQANLGKAKGDVSAIRSGILNERTKRILRGNSDYMTKLSSLSGTSSNDGDALFDGNSSTNRLLTYPLISGNRVGSWRKTASNTYRFRASGSADVIFVYNPANGIFTCAGQNTGNVDANASCNTMVN